MLSLSKKKALVLIFGLALIGLTIFIFASLKSAQLPLVSEEAEAPLLDGRKEMIGNSVEGRAIEAYSYGTGEKNLLFVGGIHGGYEWNSVLLAYEFMDYLKANPENIPSNLTLTVVPSANPDGVYTVVGKEGRFEPSEVPSDEALLASGRFNARGVDLNRNFDCKWQSQSSWRGNIVSAGSSAFSEPEAAALRDFILKTDPSAVIFWHSQANAVYASECEEGILPQTKVIMNLYSAASGYPSVDSFDAYPITGDVEGWLASIGIPAITVELSSHEVIEWEKNRAGLEALLEHYRLAK